MRPDTRFINETLSEHKKLLEYIKRGDIEKCEEEVDSHLKKLDEYLVDIEEKFINRTAIIA